MIFKTHIAFGVSLSLLPYTLGIVTPGANWEIPAVIMMSYFFSLFPDLDEPESYLSKRFPFMFLSILVSAFTEHRGATHKLWFWFLTSIIAFVSTIIFLDLTFLFIPVTYSLSYLSHLLGDGCTVSGIRQFYAPLSKKTFYSLPKFLRFRTGSLQEYIVLVIFLFIVLIQILTIIDF